MTPSPNSRKNIFSSPSRFQVLTFIIICLTAIAGVVYLLLPKGKQAQGVYSDTALTEELDLSKDSFLIRENSFDCTTLRDVVPLGTLQNIPRLISMVSATDSIAPKKADEGETHCILSFVPTGDAAGLENRAREDAEIDRNFMSAHGIPLSYRPLTMITSPACSAEYKLPHEILDALAPQPGQEWQIYEVKAGEPTTIAVQARLRDADLGCINTYVSFPQEKISDAERQNASDSLREFITAISEPLAASIAAAKADQETTGDSPIPAAPTPQASFRHGELLDCRSYVLSSSIIQQKSLGLIPAYQRIPIDLTTPLDLPEDTPLYRVAPDKKSVTCWMNFTPGQSADSRFGHEGLEGNAEANLVTTSPEAAYKLPKSTPLQELGQQYAQLPHWRFFTHIPEESQPLSDDDAPLLFEESEAISVNLYRCDDGGAEASVDDEASTLGKSCLIMSFPLGNSVPHDALPQLAQIAERIDPIAFPR